METRARMLDFGVIQKKWMPLALSLMLVLLSPAPGSSKQVRVTALSGTVTDPERKPLAGALVVARNLATGQSSSARSNTQGAFRIQPFSAGSYEITASLAGFSTRIAKIIEPGANESLTLQIPLGTRSAEAGQKEEVPASPEAKNSSPASANLINENQLLGLPLNGRSYSQLATLEAGVSDTSSTSASRGVSGGSLSVSGSRSYSNHILLDGTTTLNSDNLLPKSAAGVQLGADTVYQVQVLSSGYGAEYGRSSGGVLNSITRSGTSQLHGTLFEYLRNSKLDARNFFDREHHPPPFKRNQFGFTLTGPFKKDRTFFLFSYEGLRDRLTDTNVSFFPDQDARRGFPDSLGNPTVPVAPAVEPYLALFPMPNDIALGGGIGRNISPQFLPTNENFLTVRLDLKISDRDGIFGRYTFDDATGEESQGTHLFASLDKTRQQYLTVVGNHIFNLHALAVVRFGYTRPSDGATSLATIDIPPPLYFVRGAPEFGQIQIPGLSTLGPSAIIPRRDNTDSFQFGTQALLQQGPHTLKFGTDVHRYGWDIFSDFYKGGVWSFNSLKGFLDAGPVGTGLQVALPGAENHHLYRQTLIGFYAQDEYRINKRLLVSLGLRYEFVTKISDGLNKIVFLRDLLRDTKVQFGDFYRGNPSLRNLAPRLGITWSPWDGRRTVWSAGFGLYYDPILGYVATARRNSTPFYNMAINPNLDSSRAQFFPDALAAVAGLPYLVQPMDYDHMSSAMVLRYNLTMQQPLPGGWQFQASYVGSRGNHLLRRFEENLFPAPITRSDGSAFFPKDSGALNPAFGSISLVTSDAQSFYNALQVSANKALGHGLSMQASYTLSKSVDDGSIGHSANAGQYGLMRTLDRGLSDFDIRQRLVFNYFYNLPFGGGQRWWTSGLSSRLFGGWRLGGILALRSGTPFSAQVNVRYKDYLFGATRPNLVPGASNNPIHGVTAGCGRVEAGLKLGGPDLEFDPCAFSAPPPGTIGNVGRNTLIAPSVFNLDLSLQREFLLDTKRRLQFRAEIFNLPNHSNFNSASPVVFSGESGDRTSSAGRISKTATTSRQMQFALRFSF
jgi:carboxypeptidase family protein